LQPSAAITPRLFEAERRLGGQALLAQMLPGRAEFGGLITNLEHELKLAGVQIRRSARVDRPRCWPRHRMWCSSLRAPNPTGRTFRRKELCDRGCLAGAARPSDDRPIGVVIDWRADWIGIGIAEHLAQQGRSVRLAVSGIAAGETLPLYVRDHSAAGLHKLGVKVLTYMRLYGSDSDSVYLQHVSSGEAVVIDKVDTLVLCTGHTPVDELSDALEVSTSTCTSSATRPPPRTAEEAVYEGLKVAAEI